MSLRTKTYSPLQSELCLSQKDYPVFYSRLTDLLQADGLSFSKLLQSGITSHHKLSAGNNRPPHTLKHVYTRLAGMLRLMVQNPCGIKKLQRIYAVKKRPGVCPPKRCKGSGAFLRRSARLLAKQGYLAISKKGYYTTKKGKTVLLAAKNTC